MYDVTNQLNKTCQDGCGWCVWSTLCWHQKPWHFKEQGAPNKAINKSTKLRLLREFLQSSSSFPTGMSSKSHFRNGPESSAVTVQKGQRQTSGSLIPQMGSWMASPSSRLVKQNCVLWSFVLNSKGNISPLVFVVFSPPRLCFPNPPIFTCLSWN